MASSPYSIAWSSNNNSNHQEDSAFHEEPTYTNESYESLRQSNKSFRNSEESYSSPCPEYEDVDTAALMAQKAKGLVYNLASEGIFQYKRPEGNTNSLNLDADPKAKDKIMKSIIYCIHKVCVHTVPGTD